ncbi:MAG TPA: CHAT domain-containing protein [Drouetiella sp.]
MKLANSIRVSSLAIAALLSATFLPLSTAAQQHSAVGTANSQTIRQPQSFERTNLSVNYADRQQAINLLANQKYTESEKYFKKFFNETHLAFHSSSPYVAEIRKLRKRILEIDSTAFSAQSNSLDSKIELDEDRFSADFIKDSRLPIVENLEGVLKLKQQKYAPNDIRIAKTKLQIASIFSSGYGANVPSLNLAAYESLSAFTASYLDTLNGAKPNSDALKTSQLFNGQKNLLDFLRKNLNLNGCQLAQMGDRTRAKSCFELATKCLVADKNALPTTVVPNLLQLSNYFKWLNEDRSAWNLIQQASNIARLAKNDALIVSCLYEEASLREKEREFPAVFEKAKEAYDLAQHCEIDKYQRFDLYRLLAQSEYDRSDFPNAEKHIEEALKIDPITDVEYVSGLLVLAEIYMDTNRAKAALENLNDSLTKYRDQSANQSVYAKAFALKGSVYMQESDFDKARQAFNDAYRLDSMDHSSQGMYFAARDLNGLAMIESASNNQAAAKKYILQAAALTASYINAEFSQLSFNEQCAFLELAKDERDALLTACSDDYSMPQSYNYMMRWKGLLLESLRQKAALKELLTRRPELKNLSSQLDQANIEISSLVNSGADNQHATNFAQDLQSKLSARDALETKLYAASNIDLNDPIASFDSNKFRALLKPDEAFVDIISFQPRDSAEQDERYVAIVMKAGKGGEPRYVYLADTQLVLEMISTWRSLVTHNPNEKRGVTFKIGKASKPKNSTETGVQLDAKLSTRNVNRDIDVEAPGSKPKVVRGDEKSLTKILKLLLLDQKDLQEALGPEIKKLWICPEGLYAKVPWNSLAVDNGADSYKVCEVDSPREFVVLKTSKDHQTDNKSVLLTGLSKFEPPLNNLEGALEEVKSLKPLADNYDNNHTTMLTESAATKEAVRRALGAASVAHIATHGFAVGASTGYDGTSATRSADSSVRSSSQFQLIASANNPLLECGLYFAGGKNSNGDSSHSANVLTAQEIVGLDLSKCDLVTLSACQSGLGHSFSGQGIVGLRSAIMSAGARSMLMSLWSVPDDATNELMKRFYTYLWRDKLSKVDALAKAQNDIRTDKNHDWSASQNWAAWVLTGDGF